MAARTKAPRLSDTVKPGKDYAAKVKITEILDRDVLLMAIDKVAGSPEFSLVDPETGEIVSRDYWNVSVECNGALLTFSTGAVPIDKVLTALQAKLDAGKAELPLLCSFRKDGRTYVVE